MKFALFTTNLAGGGAEKALAKIGSGLAQRGHEVEFIVCEDAGAYPPLPGCRFTALTQRAGHGWLGKRRLAWRLRRHLSGRNHALLVSTLPFADEVAQLADLPRHACRIANTLSAELARLPADKASRRARRYRGLYGSRPLVAVSQGVAEDMHQAFGVAAERIRVIANPFDLDAIRREADEPCPQRPVEPYVIHVGRFAAQKRHDLLLCAFAALDAARRLVLLTPPDPRLDALIAQHGLAGRVSVAGFQANPYPWLKGAELLVLSSDHEGLPNVLIEALACGTRVVSTDCPSGPREVLSGELARWLVPCGNAPALASAMQSALAEPPPVESAVEAALEPYAADHAMTAWEQLAREIA